MTMIAPQLSLNFGHSLGWSYLSAGLGGAHVESEAALEGATTQFVPTDSGWVKTLNYGGGARWFISDRVGVGFDLRWYKVGLVPATDTHPGAPRASLFVAGAGVVLK
jgi:opacity protein-like surface antigen